MVYRNDVDALEARLSNIQSELDAKTRARDEARQLVAEARARAESDRIAHDSATGGPQRRRSKRIQIAIGAALMIATAVIGIALKVRSQGSVTARLDQTIEKFAEFTDEVCGCKDKACVQHVSDKMTKWASEMAKDAEQFQEMTPEQTKRVTQLGERISTCMTMSSDQLSRYSSQAGSP
ncbi:MAG: hypothetical protein H0T46_31770 [Deltaproteobacteria bacterium]|nr:hypothetical protein [Deltaproteobacteria bacterium]